jgi:hypothetical protein
MIFRVRVGVRVRVRVRMKMRVRTCIDVSEHLVYLLRREIIRIVVIAKFIFVIP